MSTHDQNNSTNFGFSPTGFIMTRLSADQCGGVQKKIIIIAAMSWRYILVLEQG